MIPNGIKYLNKKNHTETNNHNYKNKYIARFVMGNLS